MSYCKNCETKEHTRCPRCYIASDSGLGCYHGDLCDECRAQIMQKALNSGVDAIALAVQQELRQDWGDLASVAWDAQTCEPFRAPINKYIDMETDALRERIAEREPMGAAATFFANAERCRFDGDIQGFHQWALTWMSQLAIEGAPEELENLQRMLAAIMTESEDQITQRFVDAMYG